MICRAVLEAQYNDTVAILHSEGPANRDIIKIKQVSVMPQC